MHSLPASSLPFSPCTSIAYISQLKLWLMCSMALIKKGNMIYCGMSMLLRGIFVSSGVLCRNVYLTFSCIEYCADDCGVSPVMIVDARWASNFDSIVPSFRFKAMSELFYKCLPATVGVFVALRLHPFRVKNLLPYWEPQCWAFIPRCVLRGNRSGGCC